MTTYATKEFRETSIPWLPRVPEGWEVRKMKYLFKERSEKGFPNEPPLAATQNMGVVPKKVYGQRTVEVSKDFDKLKLVRKGDFVISLRSFQGGIELAYYQGIISPAYTILTPNGEIQTSYFKHLAKSAPFIGLLRQCVTGIREGQNIDYSILRKNLLPVPPLPEQRAIASYLDEKCGEIDKLIEVKEGEVGLLKEMKQGVISEAVTRGLRGGALRASSIPWLPMVPEGWEEKRNSACFRLDKRIVGTSSRQTPLLSLTTKGIRVKQEDEVGGKRPTSYDGYQLVSPDEIVFCLFDLDCSAVFSGISNYMGMISPAYRVAKCTKHILPRYADYWFRYIFMGRKFKAFSKSLRYTLTFSEFGALPIAVPPLSEQEEIVGYLDKKCGELDEAVGVLEKQVECLKELKQSMIADFVTGKRRVQL
jgi:type I restriction enzyme, S subunit